MMCPFSHDELESGPEPHTGLCCGVRPDVISSPTLTGFGEVHSTSEPQFSHLLVGRITVTWQESRDEREPKDLAPRPVIVLFATVVNRTHQSKPSLQVLVISKVSVADGSWVCFG